MDMDYLRVLAVFTMIIVFAAGNQWSFYLYNNVNYPDGTTFLKEVLGGDRKTQNPMYCGTYCMVTSSCVGFFFKENEFCRLVSTSMLTGQISVAGIQYYEKAMCLSIPNLCHYGICIPHQRNNSYTCKCSPGISGKHCDQLTYVVVNNNHDAQYNYGLGNCYSADNNAIIIFGNGQRHSLSYRFKLDNLVNNMFIVSAKLRLTIKYSKPGFDYMIYIKAIKMIDTGEFDILGCQFKDDSFRTNTQVSWNGPHLATSVGDIIETPDISSVIREVVSMPGWSEGNYLDIVFFNDDLPNVYGTEIGYNPHPSQNINNAPRLILTVK